MSKQKLELTWVGKDVRPRLEPRVLLEETGRSYTAAHRVTEADVFGNKLILLCLPFRPVICLGDLEIFSMVSFGGE